MFLDSSVHNDYICDSETQFKTSLSLCSFKYIYATLLIRRKWKQVYIFPLHCAHTIYALQFAIIGFNNSNFLMVISNFICQIFFGFYLLDNLCDKILLNLNKKNQERNLQTDVCLIIHNETHKYKVFWSFPINCILIFLFFSFEEILLLCVCFYFIMYLRKQINNYFTHALFFVFVLFRFRDIIKTSSSWIKKKSFFFLLFILNRYIYFLNINYLSYSM